MAGVRWRLELRDLAGQAFAASQACACRVCMLRPARRRTRPCVTAVTLTPRTTPALAGCGAEVIKIEPPGAGTRCANGGC
jgi:hypothetical protein